jgi:hypothetical protein
MAFDLQPIARALRDLAESIEQSTCERCGCCRASHKATGCTGCDCRTAYGYDEGPPRRKCAACHKYALPGQKVCAIHGGRIPRREERPA